MDAESYPTAVSWSLPDGQIKQTLILPSEQNIDDTNNSLRTVSAEQSMMFGAPVEDIIDELEFDIQTHNLFVLDVYLQSHWLTMLYDDCALESHFQIISADTLHPDFASLREQYSTMQIYDMHHGEEQLRYLMMIYAQLFPISHE